MYYFKKFLVLFFSVSLLTVPIGRNVYSSTDGDTLPDQSIEESLGSIESEEQVLPLEGSEEGINTDGSEAEGYAGIPDTSISEDSSLPDESLPYGHPPVEDYREDSVITNDPDLDDPEIIPPDDSVPDTPVVPEPIDLTDPSCKAKVAFHSTAYPYAGHERKPAPIVTIIKDGIKLTLEKDMDFTVSYSNNKMPGKATATIRGIGEYTGTLTHSFSLYLPLEKASFEYEKKKAYTGKDVMPKITVTALGKTLEEGSDYTVRYSKNVNPGTASIIVTGKGDYYKGTVVKTFEITYPLCAATVEDKCTYQIVPKRDVRKSLTVEADSYKENTRTILWSHMPKESMYWYIEKSSGSGYLIHNQLTDMCLSTKGNNTLNFGKIVSTYKSTSKTQEWEFRKNPDGSFSIYNITAGKYMQLRKGETANRTLLQIKDKSPTEAQKFYLVKVSATPHTYSGRYCITSKVDPNYAISVQDESKANGANIFLKKNKQKAGQIFDVLYSGNGYYRLRNVYTGKVLDVKAAGTANGTNIQQYEWNGTKAQKWKITGSSGSGYTFHSALGKVLDLYAGQAKSGNNIQLYASNGTSAQKWNLAKYSYSSKIEKATVEKAELCVNIAQRCMDMFRTNGTRYSITYAYPPGSDGQVTCGGLNFRVLYEMGYNIPVGINYESIPLENYLYSTDMKRSTSIQDIKKGSFVFVAAGNPYNIHSFIVKEFDPVTRNMVRYDAGSTAWIRSVQPLSTGWPPSWTFLSVWNFPDE